MGKINYIENFDNDDFDIMCIIKERAKQDYGLKYEIITISNGTASLIYSNHSTLTASISMSSTSLNNSVATPLAVTLRSSLLIRCDFLSNSKFIEENQEDYNQNLKFLWHWFESNKA